MTTQKYLHSYIDPHNWRRTVKVTAVYHAGDTVPAPKPKPLWEGNPKGTENFCREIHKYVNECRIQRGQEPLPGNGWDICPTCNKNVIVNALRNDAAVKTFSSKGTCQSCQDRAFMILT